jgi:hypothetical protein
MCREAGLRYGGLVPVRMLVGMFGSHEVQLDAPGGMDGFYEQGEYEQRGL